MKMWPMVPNMFKMCWCVHNPNAEEGKRKTFSKRECISDSVSNCFLSVNLFLTTSLWLQRSTVTDFLLVLLG